MRILPVVLLLAATTLAGCSGGADGATAMDLRAAAEREAREWDEDAVLAGVMSAELDANTSAELRTTLDAGEGGNESDGPSDEELAIAQAFSAADAEHGDGRAAAWMYSFAAGNRSLLVIVDADGDAIRFPDSSEDDFLFGSGVAITEWNVDSDEAARTVSENSAQARASMARDDATLIYGLGQEEDEEHPVWIFFFEGGSDDLGIYLVDATNGTYLGEFNVTEFFEGLFLPAQVGSFAGQLVAVLGPSASHTFVLADDRHQELLVTLVLDPDLPLSSVTMTVTGPDDGGSVTTGEVLSIGDSVGQVVLEMPAAGAYNVEVTMGIGVVQNYEVLWCATGFYLFIDIFGGRDPCQRL
jgi:hypothetical protein